MNEGVVYCIVLVLCLTIITCCYLLVTKGEKENVKICYESVPIEVAFTHRKHLSICSHPLCTAHYNNIVYEFGSKKVIACINVGVVNFYEEQEDGQLVLIKDIDQYLNYLSNKHTENLTA